MIFHETSKIFLVKLFPFVKLQCTLLTFAFAISDFKIWLKNFGFVQTILKFWSFELVKHKSLKVNIADTYYFVTTSASGDP